MFYKNCAGTYKVSGYTRSDGSKVASYERTCAAKHAVGEAEVTHDIKAKYMSNLQASIERNINLPQIYHKYYKLSLDFENQKRFNKENLYIKLEDVKDINLKSSIKKLCDLKNINDSTDIVIPQYGSPFMDKFINSLEFVKVIEDNKSLIEKGYYKNKCLPIQFSTSRDLRLTVGHASLYNLSYKKGVLTGTFFDGYNFEHKTNQLSKELEDAKGIKGKIKAIGSSAVVEINNNAYIQQEKRKLKNYLIVMPIILFED